MTRHLLIWSVVAALCGVAFWLLKPAPQLTGTFATAMLPWNIEAHADGTSTVFGLRLEQTTVAEAVQTLGGDHELGIIAGTGGSLALEIYFSRFSAGPLEAKLIVGVQATANDLQAMQLAAADVSITSTGARKFRLNRSDYERALGWTVKSLTLVPAANLSEEILQARFGEPATRVRVNDTEQHYLYPAAGLDITLNREGKEVLQYVAPRSFAALSLPLHKAAGE